MPEIVEILSAGFDAMRKTNLKEMYIVRYADDFRIFCRTKSDAQKAKLAVTQWLKERLKLEISPEKTRVVNTRNRYSGTPYVGKLTCTVWSGGKDGDNIKILPIAIDWIPAVRRE